MEKAASLQERFASLKQHFQLYGWLDLELLEATEGHAKLAFTVAPRHCNPGGFLHGGIAATLVDEAGTYAILAADLEGRPGVTTDLNVTYLTATPAGARVVADARALKVGRTLAYAQVDVWRTDPHALTLQGRITKYLPRP